MIKSLSTVAIFTGIITITVYMLPRQKFCATSIWCLRPLVYFRLVLTCCEAIFLHFNLFLSVNVLYGPTSVYYQRLFTLKLSSVFLVCAGSPTPSMTEDDQGGHSEYLSLIIGVPTGLGICIIGFIVCFIWLGEYHPLKAGKGARSLLKNAKLKNHGI